MLRKNACIDCCLETCISCACLQILLYCLWFFICMLCVCQSLIKKLLTYLLTSVSCRQLKSTWGAEPEVLITSLLQKIETSFESRNRVTKPAECARLQPTAGDTIVCRYRAYPRLRTIIGSGDINIVVRTLFISNIAICVKLYKYGLDRQWVTSETSTIKSSYFRFAPLVISLMRNQSHVACCWTSVGLVMLTYVLKL